MLALVVFSTVVWAGAIKVKWNANSEPDLAGYRVHYGVASKMYTTSKDVGDTTAHVIQGVDYGKRYYVAVTAYDDSGNESDFSQEVSITLTTPMIRAAKTEFGLALRWQHVMSADSYEIYRDQNPYFVADLPVALTPDTTYLDGTFLSTPAVGFYYQVIALQNGKAIYSFPRIGGYNVALYKGANLVSLPLLPANELINEVLGDQLTGGRSKSASDYVMVFKDENVTESAWQVQGTGSGMDGKWVTEDGGSVSTLKLSPDQAFWIYRRENHADSVLTFTGQVSLDSNRVLRLKKGFNFIGTAYPKVISLVHSELAQDGVMSGGSTSSSSDKIIEYNSRGYEIAWLVSGTRTMWDGQFFNEAGTAPTTIALRPGHGYIVWIRNAAPVNPWTFPNPFYLN